MYKNKGKMHIIPTTLIAILISVSSIALYDMYLKIDVNQETNNILIEKMSATDEQTKKVLTTLNVEENSVLDIIENVSSSVVGISKIKSIGETIFSQNSAETMGLGSGALVSENGYIITNQHVAGSKYGSCYVTLENGEQYNGNVVWADETIDVAIVKINIRNGKYANLGDSDKVRTGERVYAIGNPIGMEFQRTVTEGIISAIDRTIKIEEVYMEDLFQTDATINPR